MLKSLQVNNLALMDNLFIEFREGFSALTGETGAGKSILIESIGFVLGDRSNKELIRTGASKASVEAVFTVSEGSPASSFLRKEGLNEGEDLIIYRDLLTSGRSTARINGTLVSISVLKELGRSLVDLHGQHEHQSLLNEEKHLPLIDACCDDRFLLDDMRKAREMTLSARSQREEMEKQIASRARRLSTIENELAEIDSASLHIGEEEELYASRAIARNSSLIEEKLNSAYQLLYGEKGAVPSAQEASSFLHAIKDFTPDYQKLSDELENACYSLEDVAFSLRDAKQSVSFDPGSLDQIESRLYLIETLKRKYGNGIAEILNYRESISKEKDQLLAADDTLEEIKKQEEAAFIQFQKASEALSFCRKKTASTLSKSVEEHLKRMGMPNAVFHTVFSSIPLCELHENGIDDASFYFSANKGEAEKSLSRTASGGEISRVMLAIKASLSATDGIDTLIFDEIDTGISGMIAHTVAKEMLSLSKHHQVLSVTHLPQIAAYADHQYFIYKTEMDGKTVSRAVLLTEEERPAELARIMGGEGDSTALEHAKTLLKTARGDSQIKK